jgi:hypothetical protein
MSRTLRPQQEVVKATSGTPVAHPPGTIRRYCFEHVATAAKIPAGHAANLAAFVRVLREHGGLSDALWRCV